jgi:hypothetical protein
VAQCFFQRHTAQRTRETILLSSCLATRPRLIFDIITLFEINATCSKLMGGRRDCVRRENEGCVEEDGRLYGTYLGRKSLLGPGPLAHVMDTKGRHTWAVNKSISYIEQRNQCHVERQTPSQILHPKLCRSIYNPTPSRTHAYLTPRSPSQPTARPRPSGSPFSAS